MIIQNYYLINPFVIETNTVRPDLIASVDFDRWNKLHDWIKTSDVEIRVSTAFYMIEDMLKQNQGYMGGGMNYCFWFKTVDDFNQFNDQVKQIFDYHALTCKEITYE